MVLPEAGRGALTAGMLAWARALGEFGPVLVFSGATRMKTEVLPSTVFLELSIGDLEAAVAGAQFGFPPRHADVDGCALELEDAETLAHQIQLVLPGQGGAQGVRLQAEDLQVQVAGALAIYAGSIVEMATGEGKTLSATMPATVAGWCGKGCHIITVNDYLANRDAEEMGPIYKFCGLRVEPIDQETPPPGDLTSITSTV